MNARLHMSWALLMIAMVLPVPANADSYVIPFSDIREAVEGSGTPPDDAIRAYLVGRIQGELDALGFDLNGGLLLTELPIEELTQTIATDCDFFRPYEIHTDATSATITIDDGSSLTLNLDSIRSITLLADLIGTVDMSTTAWVRWGQDIPFVGDCRRINTDHGWIGLTLPFDISLDLALDLNPGYDGDLLAIVVDKQATLEGQALIGDGNLQHDFGTLSLTDLLISVFEDEMLEKLRTNASQAVADAIAGLNFRLNGRDENGVPDPTIVAFNGRTTFVLDIDEGDQAFVRDLLQQLGLPELLISMLGERGVEILLQLVVLEGAERDTYLASLGASVACDALLQTYQTPLDAVPIYTLNGQGCEVADLAGPNAGSYFSDSLCTDELAFEATDDTEFCVTQFGDQAENLLGNPASWVADTGQPNDLLPQVPSRPWTVAPSTQLDLGVLSIQSNHQPYMKQFQYKAVGDVPRGNGTCELEMRVYKSDILAQNLRPLMALHGGTWQHRGFSFFGLEAAVSQLTERGFIVFAPFYRLVGESDGNVECNGVSWHEVTEDVASALDWIKENGAALGAANEPVSVYGQSAGAHLAAWLAANRSADVRKALLYYAPIDALEFLAGAVPIGGPYDEFRDFGLRSLSRFFGAPKVSGGLHIDRINFAGLTATLLSDNWSTLIPDVVFDLEQIDLLAPPVYVARCANETQTDLSVINLAMPPALLTACMKEDLADFLIRNSFNHQLSDERVPIHVVHGSADTLVPHAQATNLCGAIDDRVLPADVFDPLTVFSCGTASRVQIVKDAEHAMELGVCLASICPAGMDGSTTRSAVAAAIDASYQWLVEDPVPNVNSISITKAQLYTAADKLAVWATSDLGSQAGLLMTVHVDGGGAVNKPLTWNPAKARWQAAVFGLSQEIGAPLIVTVSGVEGSQSMPADYRNTIDITRARLYTSVDKLAVWATSDLGNQAGLQVTIHVEGGGTITEPMIWRPNRNHWSQAVFGLTQSIGLPVSVRVVGAEGSDTMPVEYK